MPALVRNLAAVASLAVLATPLVVASAGEEPPAPIATLTLPQALEALDDHSLTLAQARSRVNEAAGIARQSLAALLPTLTVNGSYTRNNREASAAFSSVLAPLLPPGIQALPDLIIQPLQVWNVTGALRVPLVVPSAWADLSATLHSEAAVRASTEAVRLQLRTALTQAAWTAAAAESIVGATVRAVESAREQVGSASRSVEAGTGTPLAVLQAQTEMVKRESDFVRARAEHARACQALGALLGRTEPVRIDLSSQPPVPPIGPGGLAVRALAEEGLSRRPELRAQREQISSASDQVTSAWLRLAPQVSASATAFKQDVPLVTGLDYGWRVTVDVSWALYDGGFRYGKRQQAEAALAGARAAAEQQRVEIVQQVADAARDVQVAQERVRLADRQQKLASEAAAIARRGFSAGIASSLDVLDANDRLFQAEVAQADATGRVGVAQAALDRARGSL